LQVLRLSSNGSRLHFSVKFFGWASARPFF
jgi:hypothetical protein